VLGEIAAAVAGVVTVPVVERVGVSGRGFRIAGRGRPLVAGRTLTRLGVVQPGGGDTSPAGVRGEGSGRALTSPLRRACATTGSDACEQHNEHGSNRLFHARPGFAARTREPAAGLSLVTFLGVFARALLTGGAGRL